MVAACFFWGPPLGTHAQTACPEGPLDPGCSAGQSHTSLSPADSVTEAQRGDRASCHGAARGQAPAPRPCPVGATGRVGRGGAAGGLPGAGELPPPASRPPFPACLCRLESQTSPETAALSQADAPGALETCAEGPRAATGSRDAPPRAASAEAASCDSPGGSGPARPLRATAWPLGAAAQGSGPADARGACSPARDAHAARRRPSPGGQRGAWPGPLGRSCGEPAPPGAGPPEPARPPAHFLHRKAPSTGRAPGGKLRQPRGSTSPPPSPACCRPAP